MSLTSCIKKAGSALSAEDKAAILAGAQAWRKDMQAKAIVNYIRQGFAMPALLVQ